MSEPRFLVFDVGCIECGEPSGIVGLYDDEEDAKPAQTAATARQAGKWTGQHHIDIYPIGSRSRFASDEGTPE